MNQRELIAKLLEERSGVAETVRSLNDKIQTADAKLSDEDQHSFDAGVSRVKEIDARVAELDEQVRSNEAAAELQKRYAAKPGEGVRNEPEIYRSGAGGKSYFRDLHMATSKGDRDAVDRLSRNDKRVAEKRDQAGITTVAGAGGEFVPPLWLEDQFVKLARAGRITANLTPTQALPAGTDSINLPKVATGTATDVQATQNTGVTQTDLTTTSVSSGITTIAGGQTISLQLMEQSPLNIDDVVLQDLAADYAVKLNTQVLSGSGSGGNQTGILTLAGTNAVTVTAPNLAADPPDAFTDTQALYGGVADAIQRVHTNRFLPPDAIIMHPRRWAALLNSFDNAGRPLVTPSANSPMNALANAGEVASQGYVGTMQGLPVYVDAVLPTNHGSGTNEDQVIVARMADLMLFESTLRAETFKETYANQLSVFVRVYNYASFQAARYPKSISVVSGSALATPVYVPVATPA